MNAETPCMIEPGFDWTSFALGFVAALGLIFLLRFRASKRARGDLAAPPSAPVQIPQKLQAQVRLLKAEGREIEAIKLVRRAIGCDLKAAKDAVGQLR
jgi:hypothetical protein